MKGVIAIDNARTASCAAGEFDRGFDGLGARIREENLVEIRDETKQTLGEQTGKDGHVHLHEIGQIAGKHLAQRFTQQRMIAADPEHAPSAEEIKITGAGAIEKILALTGAKSDIEAKRLATREPSFRSDVACAAHSAPLRAPPAWRRCRKAARVNWMPSDKLAHFSCPTPCLPQNQTRSVAAVSACHRQKIYPPNR